jgi:hypothetical protein
MSDELFRWLEVYHRRPEPPPVGGSPASAPAGAWPSDYGPAGQTSRSGEPLVADRWAVAWKAPLEAVERPTSILVGDDVVIVNGASWRGLWTAAGRPAGGHRRGLGGCFLDVASGRLLGDHDQGGLHAYDVRSGGRRDGRIMLALPSDHTTRRILEGPGLLAILSVKEIRLGGRPNAVLEVVRAHDLSHKDGFGILDHIEPLAGIIREEDGKVQAAAATRGPVLATPEGIMWCDWLLGSVAEHRWMDYSYPRALSADESGRAYLLCDRDGDAHLVVATPEDGTITDMPLPWPVEASVTPPLVGATGDMFVTAPGHLLAFDINGLSRWAQQRAAGSPPGTITANSLVLASDDQLYAISAAGERHPLWQPPAPLVSPPVLARGRIHVASADTLYVLEPA